MLYLRLPRMWIFRQLFSEVIVLVCFSLEAIEAKLGWYKSALLSNKKSLGEICDHKSLYNTLSGNFRSHVWMFFFFFLHAPFNSSAVLNSFFKLVTSLVRTLGLGEKYNHRHKQPNAPNMPMLQIILKRATSQAGPEKVPNSERGEWDICKNCNYRQKNIMASL